MNATIQQIPDKQQRLVVLAEDTRTRMKRTALDLYHIGANLLEAQELLEYGEFLPWIQTEFGMSKSSAYRFMDVARTFKDKLPNLGNLTIAASALYQLASPDTPKEAREEALELAFAGERITNAKAVELIKKHTSVTQETEAKGESLGLPTRGDSTLPEADRIDELTHTSPMDVDDRPCAAPSGAITNSVESSLSEVLDDEHSPAPQQQDGESTKGQKKSFNRLTPLMNSSSPEHYTPRHVLDAVIGCIGEIELDPCSNSKEEPNVPAKRHFTLEDDGLSLDWKAETLFMNPPYGKKIEPWIEKLVSSHRSGSVVSALALVPARTDTQWFKRLRDYPVCFVEGRITFVGNEDPAPFPSAIFYLGDRRDKFFQAFQQLGDIWERIEPDAVGESVDELTRLRTELETAQATIVELQSKLQAAQATIAELQFKLQGTPSQTRAEVPDYTELETINNAIAATTPDAEETTRASALPSAPVPAIATPSPQPPEVQPPSKAPARKIYPHAQAELAERWGMFNSNTGEVDASGISKRKKRADFSDWSRRKDPDRVGWTYRDEERLFYPLP